MTQSLTINGKEYVPSTTLAARFKYTPDYIAKLAREEKILATQVGRQWFVEPSSLETFAHQSDVEKKIRAEELRKKRKVEHALHSQQKQVALQVTGSPLEAVAQTAIVLVCGLFLGGLGWVVSEEDLTFEEIASGAEVGAELILAGFTGDASALKQYHFVASSIESIPPQQTSAQKEEVLIFTKLPEFPPREASTTPQSGLESGEIREQFSDEVHVEQGDSGVVITPVFKDGVRTDRQFLIMPVEALENEYE